MKRAFAFSDRVIDGAVKRINNMKSIAIIGAGTMGQGIIIDLLQKTDCKIIVIDVRTEALDRAKTIIENKWASQIGSRLRKDDADSFNSRVVYTQNYDTLSDVDIVWEVATEREAVKAKIFQSIENIVNPERIAAIFSNTSSHTTEELAVLFKSHAFREKFLTVHGYFPFDVNRLIDVMKGKYASLETFHFSVVFAEQILEKTVIALPRDHHGYITDPIFQGMGAILSWDIKIGQDIVTLGNLWELFTGNPFQVLDQTGHMPYTESSRHLGQALPADDRLRGLYIRNKEYYPKWIAALEDRGYTGVNTSDQRGFYLWEGKRPKVTQVYDPAKNTYVSIQEIPRDQYWSFYEAAECDRKNGKIKSAASLIHVALANDEGGKAFRRYVLPICLYALDMIQDGFATPGQINICTRAGLRFKTGLIELIDALIRHLNIEGFLELIRRSQKENAEDPYISDMLDVDGLQGPRKGKPCLLHTMAKLNATQLLGYGRFNNTPVAEYNFESESYVGNYQELKFCEPNPKDRTACIIFNCPLRGNVFNNAVIDQLDHAYNRVLTLHKTGHCGAVLFSAAGSEMRMLGADAREFNRGWFERAKGYVPLSEEEASASSKNGVHLFRMIQQSPVATLGVFGEKWGGGAEFTYFLDLRYDVRCYGFVYDTLDRQLRWQEKNTYNQPELDFAILPGFAAVGELMRIGMGDSIIFELFDQGMTADRAYQVGVSNGVYDSEYDGLRRGYDRARQMAKDAPYSRALFKQQLQRGINDAQLVIETGEVFNPSKNPYVCTGLLALLDRGARANKMDYCTTNIDLPGWVYPEQ